MDVVTDTGYERKRELWKLKDQLARPNLEFRKIWIRMTVESEPCSCCGLRLKPEAVEQ